MKNVLIINAFVLCLLIGSACSISAQHSETHKLDKQIELQLDSATNAMMLFILKQDTAYYTEAMIRTDKSKALVKQFKDLAAKEKGLTGRSDADEISLYVEEINLLKNQSIKSTVLGDNKKTEKYKYKGESFSVGTKSKALLDQFAENL